MQKNNKSLKITIVILFVILLISSFLLFTSIEEIKLKDNSIAALTGELELQKQKISQFESNISNLRRNLSGTEELLKNETHTRQKLEEEIINLTAVTRSDYFVIGVDDNEV